MVDTPILDEFIDSLTRMEFTPERSLAVDAALIIKEQIESIKHRPDSTFSFLDKAVKLSGRYLTALSHRKGLK